MPRRSKWSAGTEIHKTNLGIPRRLWEAARIRAMKEDRNLEEIVAEALEAYLRKSGKGGRHV